ncbi:thioredoxin family protein [Paenibacillus sp.]|uniref:thioredoxin family protein n=1 Tax=Paenibacillus sp. TaxID=58172 RepID=UPI002D55AC6C|nr:thioredoxin family protein [Paenibacillus sp.]HZG57658.1 thioredoxin family protein [Paenibacillus sp.]
MAKSLAHKIGQGLTPQGFIDAMTKNREAFLAWGEKFAWANEDDREYFESLNNRDDLRCLILAADWCGDVVRNVPVVFKALEHSGVPVEVLIQEEHMETMDQFLTLGGRSIPVVIFVDTGGFVLGTWGPRPKYIQEPMVKFKAENPDRDAPDYQEKLAETRKEIGARYGEGTEYQQLIVKELRSLIESF